MAPPPSTRFSAAACLCLCLCAGLALASDKEPTLSTKDGDVTLKTYGSINMEVGDSDAIVFRKRRAEVDIHSLAEKVDKYAAAVDSITPAVKQRLDNTLTLLTDVVVKSQQGSEQFVSTVINATIKSLEGKSTATLAKVNSDSKEAIKELKAAQASLVKTADKAATGLADKIYKCVKQIQVYNPTSDKCEANPAFPLGSSKLVAAASCAAIKTADKTEQTGQFWVLKNKQSVLVWCDMSGKGVEFIPNSQSRPAKSCAAFMKDFPNEKSGLYWVLQHNNKAMKVYCLFDSKYRKGGWQLLLTLTDAKNMMKGWNHPLGAYPINLASPTLDKPYANNWVGVNKPNVGDEFLMIAKGTGKWKTFTMTHTHCGWRSNSNGVCNGCHGTYAKGQIYDEGGSKVNCGGGGCWLNACTSCSSCAGHGCEAIGFSAENSDYSRFYGGGVWQTFGSGWYGNTCGGGWVRQKTNSVFPLNVLYRPKQ